MSAWQAGAEPIGVLPLEALVGRDDDAVALREACVRSRVVTVVGAGGAGKTALAAGVAPAVAADLDVPAWWVDLQPVDDPAGVGPALAAAMDVPVAGDGRPAATALARVLGDRPMLLVLDNCEQVVDGVAEALEVLTSICPYARVLATSREVVGIAGEEVRRLGPLAVPDAGSVPTVEDLASHPATALFLARAGLDATTLEDEGRAAVAAVCRAVDGLPLAVELAAARSPALSPQQIEEALTDRFRLLSTRRRTVADRQQTLEASIEWSYDLLDAHEQRLLRSVAVFPAAFDVTGAAIVGVDGDEVLALDLLTGLIDKSLVSVQPRPSGRRFRLYESVRAFGERELARHDEVDAVRDRHVDATLVRLRGMVADESHEGLVVRSDPWLTDELDDVRAASRRAVATGRPRDAVDLWWAVDSWSVVTGTTTTASDVVATVDPDDLDRTRSVRRHTMLLRGASYLDARVDPDAVDLSGLEHLPLTRLVARLRVIVARCFSREVDVRRIEREGEDLVAELDAAEIPELLRLETLRVANLAMSGVDRNRDVYRLATAAVELSRRLGLEDMEAMSHADRVEAAATIHHPALTDHVAELSEAISRADEHTRPRLLQPLLTAANATGDNSVFDAWVASGDLTVGAVGSDGWLVFQWQRSIACIHRDDSDGAARFATEALEQGGAPPWFLACGLLSVQATALARGGHVEAATAAAEAAEASQVVTFVNIRGMVDWAWAEVHRAAGRPGRQLEHTLAVVRAALAVGSLVYLPTMLVHAADGLRGTGRPEGAARTLGVIDGDLARRGAELKTDFAAIRATVEADLRQQLGDDGFEEAAAAGHDLSWAEWLEWMDRGRGERESQRPAAGWDALTDAEVEVARRAAEGLSNAELADALFVSVNTVKTHLKRIYTKLDVSSRAELVRAVDGRRDPAG